MKEKGMINRIQHIGVAVASLDAALPYYRDVLGLPLVGIEEVPEQKIRAAVFRVGESTIEVIESTSPDGPVGKFIEKNGEGIHHLCFQVDDAAAALAAAKGKGARLIDETPRLGVHGMKIGFLHPKSTFGVLTEFAQAGEEGHE
jgi:methylmalonyl-CoA/ethylmalonyl-CoA epimerase